MIFIRIYIFIFVESVFQTTHQSFPILFLKLYLTAYMQLLKVAVYLYKEKRVLPLTKK